MDEKPFLETVVPAYMGFFLFPHPEAFVKRANQRIQGGRLVNTRKGLLFAVLKNPESFAQWARVQAFVVTHYDMNGFYDLVGQIPRFLDDLVHYGRDPVLVLRYDLGLLEGDIIKPNPKGKLYFDSFRHAVSMIPAETV